MDRESIAGVNSPALQGVFTGQFAHSLDPKKRLTIPSGWRDQVGEPRRLLVLPGIEAKCLYVYPSRDAMQRMQKFTDISIADGKARQFARVIGSRSELVEWDVQGRIRVKDDLLEYAELSNQVVLVGVFNAFELWNPDRFKQQIGLSDQASLGEAARYVGF